MFVTETVLEAMAGYFEFTRYIIDVWGLAANIDSKSRKKIMNATIFQHIGSLLSGHHPYSQRDSLDTANSVTNVFFYMGIISTGIGEIFPVFKQVRGTTRCVK